MNMDAQNLLTQESRPVSTFTLRDFLAIGFRHCRLLVLSFLGIFLAIVLYTLLQPNQYTAQMKILVKRERVDPIVSAEQNAPPNVNPGVSEDELNSEAELIKSRDLLRKVVVASDLHQRPRKDSLWARLFPAKARAAYGAAQTADKEQQIVSELQNMERRLQVGPLNKSHLIYVTYTSVDPQQAARVLQNLANLYLEMHLAVHRPPGAFEFFRHETERYRKDLADIETRLSNFGTDQGVVAAQLEKEITLQKLTSFEANFKETRAAIAEKEQRIRTFERQAASTSPRLTTQVRTSDNGVLLQQLKSTLLTLELKRTELLGKYEPGYRLVQEVEKQITQTKAALAAEEKGTLREETSAQNPIHEMMMTELAKDRSELAALHARATAIAQTTRDYREKTRHLDQKEIIQHDLVRARKAAEENYQLYLRKQEEVRISDALDKQRIVNVAIVEEATVPTKPSGPRRSLTLLVGGLLASLVSLGLAFVSDHLDPSFRTPDEAKAFLNIPLLAVLPKTHR